MSNKNLVLVIATDGFEDVELVLVRDILIRQGYDVDLAFDTDKEYVFSTYGLKIKVDLRLDNILGSLGQYRALYIPGGIGVEKLEKNPSVYKIVQHFYENNKYIGALCMAPIILANAKILNGKRAIVYPNKKYQEILIKEGAHLEATKCKYDESCSVVIDGKIITGLDMYTSFKFANEFVKLIGK
ncbi:MAG: 4-methyl-5(B-hydroxyethyl)-thiazole monophosphate biosynthesis protein [Candidatus Hepatoplasma vulgare]|nr:MAG: 4-methyl-5(B-hydroxyethyl)-thiazole monophosphate biosynthesis protein [Candidatus Hepatoplasma sp.]